MTGRIGAIVLSIWLVGAASAQAGQHINATGKYSVWIPDQWVVTEKGSRIDAHNPADNVQVAVGPLPDATADLDEEDVTDFVDEEIDDMKVTSDKLAQQAGQKSRIVEGTGIDEGDAIVFRAVAIDHVKDAPVIEVLVYGELKPMASDNVKQAVERILGSFKPM